MIKENLRNQITHEDQLLGKRTTAFLIGNGFLMGALGIIDTSFEKHAIAALGLFASIIWLVISWQSRMVLAALHQAYDRKFPHDKIKKLIAKNTLWKRKWIGTMFGPTELMSFWLPFFILATWFSINLNLHFTFIS